MQGEALGFPISKISRDESQNWSSPAFLKRKSLPALSAFNSLYDPFDEDNELVDGQRRKRLKFGRGSAHWRFADRTPSPEKQDEETVDDIENSLLQEALESGTSRVANPELPTVLRIDSQLPGPLAVPDVERSQSSPAALAIDTQAVTPKSLTGDDGDDGVQTPEQPRLKPLSSDGLPLVSPLMPRKGKVSEYFQYGTDYGSFNEQRILEPTIEETTEIPHDELRRAVAEDPLLSKADSPTSDSSVRSSISLLNTKSPPQSTFPGLAELQEEASQYGNYEKETTGHHDTTVRSQNEFASEDHRFLAGNTTPEEPISRLFSESWRLETVLHGAKSIQHGSDLGGKELIASDAAQPEQNAQDFDHDGWVRSDQAKSGGAPSVTKALASLSDLVDDPTEWPRERPRERHPSESHSQFESDHREGQEMVEEADEQRSIIENEESSSFEDEFEVAYSSEADASDAETEGGANRSIEVISVDSEDDEVSDARIPQVDGASIYANIEVPKYRRAFSVVEKGDQQALVSESSKKASKEVRGGRAPVTSTDHVEASPHDGSFTHTSTETPTDGRDGSVVEIEQRAPDSKVTLKAPEQVQNGPVSIIAKDEVGSRASHGNTPLFNDHHLLPFTPEASGLSEALLEDASSQEHNVNYPLLPETTLQGQDNPSPQSEREASQEVYDKSPPNHLPTPLATQPLLSHAVNSEFVGEVEVVDDNRVIPIPKPSLSQESSGDEIAEVMPAPFNPLIGKLRELRNSSGSFSAGSTHGQDHPDIGTWFSGGKDGQIAEPEEQSGEDSDEESIDVVDAETKADGSKMDVATPLQDAVLESSVYPGFSTPLSYFAPLSTLAQHFNSTIDVFATVVSATKIVRSKKGPRDYFEIVYITDPSSATSKSVPPTTATHIFRPYKIALPLAQTGDVILLRNFKVQTQKQKPMLLSTESSAWAVFREGHEVQMRGPQVEFGPEERGFVKGMFDWWGSLTGKMQSSLVESAPKAKEAVKAKKKERVSGRPSMTSVHELRDGTRYTDERADGMNGLHELRDGTVYADESG